MDTDKAIALTQDLLAQEGGTMGDLLGHFRNRVSPTLIDDAEWERVLACARTLPITMGALPFGFELPLHVPAPQADLGVSMASGTRSAEFFRERARVDRTDETLGTLMRLFSHMEGDVSPLRDIVGRKVMLEYDIGSAEGGTPSRPAVFLRPGERPIVGAGDQVNDVLLVGDTLVSSHGWTMGAGQRKALSQTYLAQPEDTRMDSFGMFPSRSRAIRLAIMGFGSRRQIETFLARADWPGEAAAVDAVMARFMERVNIVRTGVNIDVTEEGLGPALGLTPIVRQRYTKDSRYWLDGLTDWAPFLDALSHEDIVVPGKLEALAGWVTKPEPLFARSGRYVLLRGIHHIKLVMSANRLCKAKAYVFMVLSGAVSF
ncbi:MAG: hypothetical protein OXI95_06495 [bacterium]|nr:hypothetical protein [bacterium]